MLEWIRAGILDLNLHSGFSSSGKVTLGRFPNFSVGYFCICKMDILLVPTLLGLSED